VGVRSKTYKVKLFVSSRVVLSLRREREKTQLRFPVRDNLYVFPRFFFFVFFV